MPKLLLAFSFIFPFSIAIFGQPWPKAPITDDQLIFPFQEKHVHGSSIVSLPNGDLLTAWFYGSGERKEDDVRIMGARLKKGAKQWSDTNNRRLGQALRACVVGHRIRLPDEDHFDSRNVGHRRNLVVV